MIFALKASLAGLITGGAILTWWVVPIMSAVGFVTPWPYNYWRLKKFNESCH